MKKYNEILTDYHKNGFVKVFETHLTDYSNGYTNKQIDRNYKLSQKILHSPREVVVSNKNGVNRIINYPADEFVVLYNKERGLLSLVRSTFTLDDNKDTVATNDLYYVTTKKIYKNSVIFNEEDGIDYRMVYEPKPSKEKLKKIIEDDIAEEVWPVADRNLYVGEYRGANGMYSSLSLNIFDYMAFASGQYSLKRDSYNAKPILTISHNEELETFIKACTEGNIDPVIVNNLFKNYDSFDNDDVQKTYKK